MLKIITFCIVFFSGSIFANNCSEHVSKNLMTLEGKVVNVGPDHSMEVVIKTGEKSYYLQFQNRETKKYFHQNINLVDYFFSLSSKYSIFFFSKKI